MLKKYLSYKRARKLAKELQEKLPDGIKMTISEFFYRNTQQSQIEIDVPCYWNEQKTAILFKTIWDVGVSHRINLSAEKLDDQIYSYKIFINLENRK